jgi:hypothetical protein
MGSAVAAWGAGWAARSPDPVKATSKVTSSTPLRRRNARWSVLALTFSTAMRDREERRTVVRIGQDRAAELLPQRAVDKVGLQLCARCAAVARSSMGTTKRSTTLTRPGYAAPTGAPASHSIASVVACRGHTGGRQGKCLFWKLSFSEAYTVSGYPDIRTYPCTMKPLGHVRIYPDISIPTPVPTVPTPVLTP